MAQKKTKKKKYSKNGKPKKNYTQGYRRDDSEKKGTRLLLCCYCLIAVLIAILVCLFLVDKNEQPASSAEKAPIKETSFIHEEELDSDLNKTPPAEYKKTEDTVTPEPGKKSLKKLLEKKTPLWEQNSVKTSALPENKFFIAVIIDDMGIDKPRSDAIIEIPAPLTVSFITYAKDIKPQADKARKNGKEIMLHVPMQPTNPKIDSGPNTLTVTMNQKDISDVFKKTIYPLIKSLKPAGANNHMGSKFTEYQKGMHFFMKDFAKTGLYFVDSATTKDSVALQTADRFGVPTATRNVFLDNKDDVDYVLGQLALLEKAAQEQGFAIDIGHPHTSTAEALKLWVDTLDEKGFCLVPASVIIKKRMNMDKK